jgi:hypothetical protein
MKKRTIILSSILMIIFLITILFAEENSPSNWGLRKTTSFNDLLKNFEQPDMIYAPFAFWFWDTPLDKSLAADMSREMSKQRMNPGYVHARWGMPHDQWLSQSWFESFDSALKEAEAANAYLGYVDEYTWPSGMADGRVLKAHPELAAISLKWQTYDVEEGALIVLPESFFTIAAKLAEPGIIQNPKIKTINSSTIEEIGSGPAFTWHAPAGKWRVYSFTKYHRRGIDGGDVNYLDRRLPEAFIEIAHEPYKDFFGDRMGKSIPGVFFDHEGSFGFRLVWSDDLDREYKEKKGRDIRLTLPLLIDEDVEGVWTKARWDWFDVVSDIYADSFLKGINDWLEERNLYCVSNLWEESLLLQAVQVGDFFKGQRVFSFPGNDCLLQRGLKVLDFKETQSITEFEGRRFQSEMMGVAGWQVSPVAMKKVLNSVIAWGVSHVVPHGVYLNRKLSTIPYPPDWFTSNPYWRYFHLWTDFARRASYINSHGYVVPDVLLLNPMDSVWGLVGGDIFDSKSKIIRIGESGRSAQVTGHGKTIEKIDEIYSTATMDLAAARIEYLVADKYYLRQMDLSPDGLLVRKDFKFKAIILPQMFIMPLDVAEKIVAFAKAGGYVYLLGDLPEGSTDNGLKDPKMKDLMERLLKLPSVRKAQGGVWQLVAEKAPFMNSQVKFESGRFAMVQQHRRIDNRDFFWFVNNTDSKQECTLAIQDVKGLASIWDCETGSKTNVPSQSIISGSRINLTFQPYEAFWLVFDSQKKSIQSDTQSRESWLVETVLDGPWNIRIDRSVQPHPVAPRIIAPDVLFSKKGEMRPLASWLDWDLDQFSGFVDYTTTFNSDIDGGRVILDLGEVKHMAEVWVNGKAVGYRLWPPFEFDIRENIRKGKNKVHIRIGNVLANAMKQHQNEKNPIATWGWRESVPKEEDFDAGLFGPVVIKRIQ